MPYIASERLPDRGRRGDLDPFIKLLSDEMVTHGELNYCISRLAVLFLAPLISQGKKVGYTELNAVWADIQAAANEFYSQPIGDYEDKKREENGDVYSELRGL